MMPDWSRLHSFNEQPWKSFEELCYQVAFRLFSSKGDLIRVDDTGGGDGVEFYLVTARGKETGWQAKFYYPHQRLTTDRKRHITESLETSLKNHRKLEKWILCTPTTFTGAEQRWFREQLQKKAGKVRLEHWSASKIDAMLAKPEMAGVKLNFFGALELTAEWFRRQVTGQLRNVKDKYNPLLHTEGPADLAAHALLGDKRFLDELTRIDEKYSHYSREFTEKAGEAQNANPNPLLQTHYSETLGRINDIQRLIERGKNCITHSVKVAQAGSVEDIDAAQISKIINDIESKTEAYYVAARALADANHKLLTSPETETAKNKEQFDSFYRVLSRPVTSCLSDLVDLLYSLSHLVSMYSSHVVHFLGDAGVGKTHLSCNLSAQRIEKNFPAVVLLGRDFPPGIALKKKILEICDVPAPYSFEDFLSALDSYAFSRRTKAVIAIDGLNESKTPDVWKDGLGELESAVEGRSRVALLTTCRASYVRPIWGTHPKNSHSIEGFGSERVEEAIQKYFDYYRIVATLTSASLRFFQNPLFLKIFCESQNPERNEQVTVHIGEQSFLSIFEAFLKTVNIRICKKLSKASAAEITQNKLLALAKEIWTKNSRDVPFERAVELLDKLPIDDVDWEKSLTRTLEDESLLIMRDWEGQSGTQRVSFTYDLLGGYLVAKAVFEGKNHEEARALLLSQEFGSRLLSDDFTKLHPMWGDILRCAAVLIPERFQLYLHSEVAGGRPLNFGVRALFEMSPSAVRDVDKHGLATMFNTVNNRKALLTHADETALALEHPLNWEFWSGLLKQLSTAERDESWTEVVRGGANSILSLISNFERECRKPPDSSGHTQKRLSLEARYVSWFLVSTHRRVRDTATKALYWYGRRFPRELFALTLDSFDIGDTYVRERLVAACYGVAMALCRSEGTTSFGREVLPNYARALYQAIFGPDAKHGTTHALIRDYAKHTLDLALLTNPSLLTIEERKRIVPPYREGGIRRLRKGKDMNDGQYRGGNAPFGMDFHNYTLGRLVPDRRNYDYDDAVFKKVESHVWWRIYKLGYSLKRFGEIDKEIAARRYHYSFRSADEGRIDRYGKKYSWIAFFELYGLLQDRGILPMNWSESDARPSDVDIEPSFPEGSSSLNPLQVSFLEPGGAPACEWVSKGPVPDLMPYLHVRKLSDKEGPWVLVDGSLTQENEEYDRRIDLHVIALVLPKGDVVRLVETKNRSITEGYWMPRSPSSHYAFVGEMPWCESIPENGWTNLELVMSTRRRLETKKEVAQRLELPEIWVEFVGSEKPGQRLSMGGRFARSREPQEITERIVEKFEVLVPTTSTSWESYHTETSEGQGPMLAKDLAGPLGLWVDLPTTDFRDAEGKRATFTCDWGNSWYKNHGRFVYIRQDLFDRYLGMYGLGCAWGLWGERGYPLRTHREHERGMGTQPMRPIRVTFQNCWSYPLIARGKA